MAWFYALLLFGNAANGMRMEFIRKQLGLGTKGAARLCTQIRHHMAACARPEKVGGPGKMVHVDEVHIRYFRGHNGRHEIVWGCACEDRVLTCIVPNLNAGTIRAAVERFVAPGSVIVSDQHASYKQLRRLGWSHVSINHSRSFSNKDGLTNNLIEVYWSSLRHTLRSYRAIEPERLWLYIAEIEYRYNRRHGPLSLFEELISHFPEITLESIPKWRARYFLRPPA